MDTTTLISSIITGAFAILVCMINNNAASKKRDIAQEKSLAVIETKLENLTAEVQIHNNFAVRMPVVEANINALEKRITNLENK